MPVSLTGYREAVAAFQKLPDVSQQRLGQAVQQTAFAVLQKARSLVRIRTGALEGKLDYSFSDKTGTASVGIAKGGVDTPAGYEVPAYIGHLVEFGHGGPHPADPHPFMIPAAESEQDNFLKRCQDAGKQMERDLSSGGGLL
jgi:hypothetical protein